MENFEEMEMPVPCQKCGEWFDLNDGYGSKKWFPNIVICASCFDDEQKELDLEDEIYNLKNEISELEDAIDEQNSIISDCKQQIDEYENSLDIAINKLRELEENL